MNDENSPNSSAAKQKSMFYDKIPDRPFELSTGDESLIQQIGAHIARHLGTPKTVLHEIISDAVHIDIHILEPTAERPHYTLVTSGMSERPMKVPPEADAPAHIELVLCLPASWPMDQESWKDQAHYWPIGWLKFLARFPHAMNSWLGLGHTFPNSEAANPYTPDTALCCALLNPSLTTPQEFWCLTLDDGRTIGFLGVCFITADEMQFKLEQGAEALYDRLRAANITELVQPARKSLLQGAFTPAQADIVRASYATSPGHVPARLGTLLSHFPQLWRYPVGIWFALALAIAVPWAGIPLLALLAWRWIYVLRAVQRVKTWFRCGNALPGLVVHLNPLRVAVLANLTNDGGAPYYAVKIQEQPIPAFRLPGASVGSRVATVCTYGSPAPDASGAELSRWSDVTPFVVNLVNTDPVAINQILQRFEASEWAELQAALDQVPNSPQPGLYPVDLAGGAKPAPLGGGKLRLAGHSPVAPATVWKIIGGDGKEYGPYTLDELRQWHEQGLINAESLAQKSGDTDWRPLGTHAETEGWFQT